MPSVIVYMYASAVAAVEVCSVLRSDVSVRRLIEHTARLNVARPTEVNLVRSKLEKYELLAVPISETRSSAVAERPRDASCLSVFILIPRVLFFCYYLLRLQIYHAYNLNYVLFFSA